MILSTILIAVPVVVLALIGLVYLLAPGHLSYHKQVIEALGEKTLLRVLQKLEVVCMLSFAVELIPVRRLLTGKISIWNIISPIAAGMMWVIASAFMLGVSRVPTMSLLARRLSGIAMIMLAGSSMLLLGNAGLQKSRLDMSILTSILAFAFSYTAGASFSLGHQSGAKTPWPILGLLGLSSALGGVLVWYIP